MVTHARMNGPYDENTLETSGRPLKEHKNGHTTFSSFCKFAQTPLLPQVVTTHSKNSCSRNYY